MYQFKWLANKPEVTIMLSGMSSKEQLMENIKILSATPHTDNIYTDVDLTCSVAIAVGTEQTGLTERWMTECDLPVVIPMLGQIDSLNVATATTILLYEAARQRNWKMHGGSAGK